MPERPARRILIASLVAISTLTGLSILSVGKRRGKPHGVPVGTSPTVQAGLGSPLKVETYFGRAITDEGNKGAAVLSAPARAARALNLGEEARERRWQDFAAGEAHFDQASKIDRDCLPAHVRLVQIAADRVIDYADLADDPQLPRYLGFWSDWTVNWLVMQLGDRLRGLTGAIERSTSVRASAFPEWDRETKEALERARFAKAFARGMVTQTKNRSAEK